MSEFTFIPQDNAARESVANSLGETLFVEAGAGTGKTTSLVSRIMTLVQTGTASLDRIAAITFTEAAAAELRERVRDELEAAASDETLPAERRERSARGVEDIDQSYIGTLHGFASSLLFERPLEAGLPPAFDVMDAIESDLDFDKVWRGWIDAALDDAGENGDEPRIRTMPLALALGMNPDQIRQTAAQFHGNYDLIADAEIREIPKPEAAAIPALIKAAPELERLCGYSKIGDGDALFDHVQRLLIAIRGMSGGDADSPLAYRQLVRMGRISQRRGAKNAWKIDPVSDENAATAIKNMLSGLQETAVDELSEVRRHALMPILAALKGLATEYASERKRNGRAGFHDLLVWARDMLRDDAEGRDHFRNRFSHLLIDEVQDTDPIQAEIAMYLAASDGDVSAYWRDIQPKIGKLFVVGDRKQSIYRFRRADVRQVTALKEAMAGTELNLSQNFRSQKPIIDWVNHVFGVWMPQGSDQQADYVPLNHRWEALTDHAAPPGVWNLGEAMDAENIGPVRAAEVLGIAAAIRKAVAEGWRVLDADAMRAADDDIERYKPARYSDICLLMPRRTGLRSLEIALENAGVPYRLDGSSLVFETQEVRDLMNCLRAVDDPADQVALVAALRSPAFACSDVDLLDFRQAGGRFDYLADNPRTPEGTVKDAFADLRALHEARTWESIPVLIEKLVRDRRLMEAALGNRRTREMWRRYRFIVESARAFSEAGGDSLRGFIEWVDRQMAEQARITETPVPEDDEDAVRVMTVHGAKGLEFPIVILTGLNSANRSTAGSVLFDRETGGVQVRMGTSAGYFMTEHYEELRESESEMERDEAVRLLYVAATRARDHLILSMYRRAEDNRSSAAKIAGIMRIGEEEDGENGGEDDESANENGNPNGENGASESGNSNEEDAPLWRELDVDDYIAPIDRSGADEYALNLGARFGDRAHSMSARAEWLAERERVMRRMGAPASVSATGLAQIDKDEPEEAPDEPWRRGRGGAPIGRAVHSVLQTIDLAAGAGADETARAQAVAEGIPDRASEVARLARTALDSDIVRRAVASGRLWREAPMATPVADGGAMQGYIDLLFEENGELVVVDYKTDAIDEAHVPDAAERYRLQAGAYALMVSRATGKRVKEIVFLFLRPKSEQSYANVDALAAAAQRAAERGFGV